MSTASLTDRHIRALIQASLISTTPAEWVADLTGGPNPIPSDQVIERFEWLNDAPAVRKWEGGRRARTLVDLGIDVVNESWETTIDIKSRDMTFDKIGMHQMRIGDLSRRAAQHWNKLSTDVLVANPTCYDGVALFADAHVEGESGTQDNLLGGTAAAGTDPTAEEMKTAILDCIEALRGFKDSAGEPLNEDMQAIRIICPHTYEAATLAAITADLLAGGGAFMSNVLSKLQMPIRYSINPRLTSQATFYVCRADTSIPTVIRTEMGAPKVGAKGEGSEYEFDTDHRQYGIAMYRGAAPGRWQNAVSYTFT